MTKGIGPNTDHCGTPTMTEVQLDKIRSRIYRDLFGRNAEILEECLAGN